jgi:hypothetical protein
VRELDLLQKMLKSKLLSERAQFREIVLNEKTIKVLLFMEIFDEIRKILVEDLDVLWVSEDRKILEAFIMLRKEGKIRVTKNQLALKIFQDEKKDYVFYRKGVWLNAFNRLVNKNVVIPIRINEKRTLYTLNEELLPTLIFLIPPTKHTC